MRSCGRCGGLYPDDALVCAKDGERLSSHDPLLGEIIQEYRIVGTRGRGGMGTVYVAQHIHTGVPVAIKVLSPRFAGRPDLVERFRTEATTVSKLRHPNVVEFYDWGALPDARPYSLMELLHGEDLASYLRRIGWISAGEAIRIIGEVLDGISVAHDAGVVHRDLKPENLFVAERPDGSRVMKVLDFGVAKLLDAARSAGTGSSTRRTLEGSVVGSGPYMSPEQAAGRVQEIGPATDMFAIGVILYLMLTGEYPFQHLAGMAAFSKPPKPASQRVPGLPGGVDGTGSIDAILSDLLEVDPNRRAKHARAVAHALRSLSKTLPPIGAAGQSARLVPRSGSPSLVPPAQNVQLPKPALWQMPTVATVIPARAGHSGSLPSQIAQLAEAALSAPRRKTGPRTAPGHAVSVSGVLGQSHDEPTQLGQNVRIGAMAGITTASPGSQTLVPSGFVPHHEGPVAVGSEPNIHAPSSLASILPVAPVATRMTPKDVAALPSYRPGQPHEQMPSQLNLQAQANTDRVAKTPNQSAPENVVPGANAGIHGASTMVFQELPLELRNAVLSGPKKPAFAAQNRGFEQLAAAQDRATKEASENAAAAALQSAPQGSNDQTHWTRHVIRVAHLDQSPSQLSLQLSPEERSGWRWWRAALGMVVLAGALAGLIYALGHW